MVIAGKGISATTIQLAGQRKKKYSVLSRNRGRETSSLTQLSLEVALSCSFFWSHSPTPPGRPNSSACLLVSASSSSLSRGWGQQGGIALLELHQKYQYLDTGDVFLQGLLQWWYRKLHQLVGILVHLASLVAALPLCRELGKLQSGPIMLLPARLLRHRAQERTKLGYGARKPLQEHGLHVYGG